MFRIGLHAALFALLAGCAASDSPDTGGGGAGNPDAGAGQEEESAPDLGSATFEAENVSKTSETMGFHGKTTRAGGVDWVVWAETHPEVDWNMNIRVASPGAGSWDATELTDEREVQNTFPSIGTTADGAPLVAWSGRPDPAEDIDIYLSTAAGGAWGEREDITSAFEEGEARNDYYPVLSISERGQAGVFYLSEPIDEEGSSAGPPEIRFLKIQGGSVQGYPETVIAADPDNPCGFFDAVIDSGGTYHVVAPCGPAFQTELEYATGSSGAWASETLELAETVNDLSASLAADEAGRVHLVWRGDESCAGGTCSDVYYAVNSGSGFSSAVNVTRTPDVPDLKPSVACDPFGRALIAYGVRTGSPNEDIYLSWTDEETGDIVGSRPLAEDEGMIEQAPNLAVDPESGAPIVTYEGVVLSSDPLNVEIFRAGIALDEP